MNILSSSILSGVVLASTLFAPLAAFAQNGQVQAQANGRVYTGVVSNIQDGNLTLRLSNHDELKVRADEAKLIRRFGADMKLTDVQVNDEVRIQGKTQEDVFVAKHLQDLSLQARNGVFVGTVASVDAAGKTLVLNSRARGSQTIYVNADTKIIKDDHPVAFLDLVAGETVRVTGVWDRTNQNVTATRIEITTPFAKMHIAGVVKEHASAGVLTVLSDTNGLFTVEIQNALLVSRDFERTHQKMVGVGDRVDVWGRAHRGSVTVRAYFVHDMTAVPSERHVLTLSDNHATIQMHVGDRVMLRLGQGYLWTSSSSDASVLARVNENTSSTQGTYEAKAAGQAELTATGDPRCRLSAPACMIPSLLFQAHVDVVVNES